MSVIFHHSLRHHIWLFYLVLISFLPEKGWFMYFIVLTRLFVHSLSYSTTRVLCAGKVSVDRTQPQTHQGYQEWTSLPPPHPLPPRAHLAMRMLPATHRFPRHYQTPHIQKPHNQLRPSGSSPQLRPEPSQDRRDDMSGGELWILLQTIHSVIIPPPPVQTGRWIQLLLLLLHCECLRRRDWVVFMENPERVWI